MNKANLGDPLTALVLDATERKEPLDTREVLVTAEIGPQDREENVVAYVGTRKDPVKKALSALNFFGKTTREVRLGIRTDARIALDTIDAQVPHSGSRIVYTAQVDADLRTPKRRDQDKLRACAIAFAECSLTEQFDAPVTNAERSATRYLRDNISEWFSRRLEGETDLRRRKEQHWLDALNAELRSYLEQSFGLEGSVKIKLITEHLENIRISAMKVETESNERYPKEVPVTLTMDVSIADDHDLFDHPLDDGAMRSLLSKTTRNWVKSNVELHAYRFETAWKDDLKRVLDTALSQHGRKLSNLVAECEPARYQRIALNVQPEPLQHEPFGWTQAKTFEFTCSANMECVDAGKFEEYRSRKNGHDHEEWLRGALQRAVETLLHGRTYTELMVQWYEPMRAEDEGYSRYTTDERRSFDDQIKKFIGAEAESIGWRIQTLLAQPDNVASKLREGIEIVIPEDEPYQVMQKDGATVSYHTTVRFAIPDLRTIRTQLDNNPDIEKFFNRQIRDICERSTVELSADDFYRNFKGTTERPGFTENLGKAIADNLHTFGAGRIEVQIRPAETDDVKIYKNLTTADAREVEFILSATEGDAANVKKGAGSSDLQPLKVEFLLKITGIAARNGSDGWGTFLSRDWNGEKKRAGEQDEIGLVLNRLPRHLEAAFQHRPYDDVRFRGKKQKQLFETDLESIVEDCLFDRFGLSGKISAVIREETIFEKNLRLAAINQQNEIAGVLRDRASEIEAKDQRRETAATVRGERARAISLGATKSVDYAEQEMDKNASPDAIIDILANFTALEDATKSEAGGDIHDLLEGSAPSAPKIPPAEEEETRVREDDTKQAVGDDDAADK